jgi:hypothetical protein
MSVGKCVLTFFMITSNADILSVATKSRDLESTA